MSEFKATRRGFLGSAAVGAVGLVAPKNSGREIAVPDVEARSGEGWELDGLDYHRGDFWKTVVVRAEFEKNDKRWSQSLKLTGMGAKSHPRRVAEALRVLAENIDKAFE